MNNEPKDGAQSIHRAVSILRAVAAFNENGARLSTISRKVGLHVTTTRRILLVLLGEGLVAYDAFEKLYHLGHDSFSFVYTPKDSLLREICRPVVETISQETGDTVYLAVRAGNDTLCIDRSEGSSTVRIIYDIGMRIPLGIGASGQAILSVLADEEVDAILKANTKRYTHHHLTIKKVKSLVVFARKYGFSFNEGNHQKGITGVGVPLINNRDVPIGAITVSSICERLPLKRAKNIFNIITNAIDHVVT